MTVGSSARDGEIEALVVDRYLESLLARAPRDTTDVPEDLRATADRLATGLPRYHPSFRGGVVTSAAISLAAAWMAWRRGRPPADPMMRAVRAVARTRIV